MLEFPKIGDLFSLAKTDRKPLRPYYFVCMSSSRQGNFFTAYSIKEKRLVNLDRTVIQLKFLQYTNLTQRNLA
jgi:DNA/RNA endonuclease G (NUC1)